MTSRDPEYRGVTRIDRVARCLFDAGCILASAGLVGLAITLVALGGALLAHGLGWLP